MILSGSNPFETISTGTIPPLALQGIHVHVGNIDDGAEATVAVQRQAPESGDPPRKFSIRRFGSMWHLMQDGRYEVTVTVDGLAESTKLVSVAREDEDPMFSEFLDRSKLVFLRVLFDQGC